MPFPSFGFEISISFCNFYADILQIYWQIINISAKYLQFLCRYFADMLTDNWHICKYLQLLCRYFADMLSDNQHICKISATFMQIFCRYCRPCCSYAAVLQQICDRYLQTFYIYVSLVRVHYTCTIWKILTTGYVRFLYSICSNFCTLGKERIFLTTLTEILHIFSVSIVPQCNIICRLYIIVDTSL
jgi:hypothetical protein